MLKKLKNLIISIILATLGLIIVYCVGKYLFNYTSEAEMLSYFILVYFTSQFLMCWEFLNKKDK